MPTHTCTHAHTHTHTHTHIMQASMLTDHEVAQAFARQRKLLSKILLDCPHLRTAAQMITVC